MDFTEDAVSVKNLKLMDKEELIMRTRRFAILVFKLCNRFPRNQSAKVVTYQLLKASSSVAANYRAVNMAKSDADFVNKLEIVLEEADESNFWLMFLSEVNLIDADDRNIHRVSQNNEQKIKFGTPQISNVKFQI